MQKKYGIQLIALTAVVAALAGCGRERNFRKAYCGHDSERTCSEADITAYVADPRVGVEKKLDALAFQLDQITTQTAHGCLSARTAPHTLNKRLFLTGDFFFWKANEDNLDYLTESEVTLDSSDRASAINFDKDELHFKWDPGFRLGIGYNFGCHDHWDLYLNWTYYYGKASDKFCEEPDPLTFLFPEWFPDTLGSEASFAEAHWTIHYNTLDLELGRHYFVSETLSLRPFVGLRGAWLDQTYKVEYDGEFFISTSKAALLATTKMKAENDFAGGGLRTGAGLLWHFTSHWAIDGRISASLLYGRFDIDQDFEGVALTSAGSAGGATLAPLTTKVDDNYRRIRTNLEAALGFMWEKYFVCSGRHLSIGAYYELSEWYRQNELSDIFFTNDASESFGTTTGADTFLHVVRRSGDLGFQGVSLKIKLDF